MAHKFIQPSGGFCLLFAFLLLLIPLPWVLAFSAAAIFHELCHYIAIRFCTGSCPGLRIYSFAAHLPLPEMSRGREVLCALAGPAGGLLLLLFARWLPRLALCALVQSVYNLLPIYPLDGGRALQSGLLLFLAPPIAENICHILEILCKLILIATAIYGCIWLKLGLFPLLMVTLLLIRIK